MLLAIRGLGEPPVTHATAAALSQKAHEGTQPNNARMLYKHQSTHNRHLSRRWQSNILLNNCADIRATAAAMSHQSTTQEGTKTSSCEKRTTNRYSISRHSCHPTTRWKAKIILVAERVATPLKGNAAIKAHDWTKPNKARAPYNSVHTTHLCTRIVAEKNY
jgi:hypothetical protein